MKQMIKSKVLMGFVVMVLGVTYINSANISKLETTESNNETMIAMNIN